MPGMPEQVTELDRRIAAAFTDLTIARTRFASFPSGEVLTACEAAETSLNELLDLRFALTHPELVPADPTAPLQAA
jgi:hypothetical protein